MEKNKTYEIETIEQLINISTTENFENLGTDFLLWLNHINHTFAELRKDNPKYENMSNSEIAKVKFVWTDDGKQGLTGVKLTNITNGEVTNIKLKK
jgi:hypothetical protein